MNKILKAQLKKVKSQSSVINPDPNWLVSNRVKLLNQIGNTSNEEQKIVFDFRFPYNFFKALIPTQIYSTVRVAAVFVLVGMITVSGWIASVGATQSCLPGDICYGVKLATEKTQAMVMSVTGSETDKTKLHLGFAVRRANEAKEVVSHKEDSDASKQAEVAIKKMEESIQTVNESIKKNSEKTPEAVMEVKKEVEIKTQEIGKALKEVDAQTNTVDVSTARQLVKEANLNAVAAVVQTKEAGRVNVSDADIKTMVDKAISDSVNDTGEIKNTAQATSDLVKQINEQASKLPVAASSTVAIIFVSSTNQIATITASTTVITAITASTTAAIKEVNESTTKKTDETQKNLQQATSLSNNNQMLEAIQKVKEAGEVNKETEKSVNEAKKAIETVTGVTVTPAPVVIISTSTLK